MWIFFSQITKFIKITRIIRHSCYRDAWKSTVYSVKTFRTDISGNIHRKCPIFFLTSIYQTGSLPKQFTIVQSPNHLVLIRGGFYYWIDACSNIARNQIWKSRQNWHACQIATKRWNLLKLFAHCLDTQIHLRDQKSQHKNPLKNASLSENVMKEDERVLFQPFHA